MKTEQKPEMTPEEFLINWGMAEWQDGEGKMRISTKAMSDLRSVIRGELIEYDKFLARRRWGGKLTSPQESVDEFLNNNQ